jgi:hypothetical protein
MIEDFKVERMKTTTRYGRQRKPASVNGELAILSGMFSMAVDCEEIAQNLSSVQRSGYHQLHLS